MKIRKMIPWIIVFLYTLWIFSNSLTIGETSGNISGRLARFLLQYVNAAGFTIAFDTFHFYVRKAAHVSEYALLGFLVVIAIHLHPLCRPWLNFVSLWILIPSLDETIQHFVPDRYGCFRDVCIDMSGFTGGAFLSYLILLILADLKKRMTKKSA